jgi:hypothetical protein
VQRARALPGVLEGTQPGEEAAKAGQLRGEIRVDAGGATKREQTLYRGSHYVECFIVKNGVCVARDRQPVFITY